MLGGRMVWVGMSRGRFVGGRNVKAPKNHVETLKLLNDDINFGELQGGKF